MLDPKHWTDEFHPQPEFNLAGYQARLDKICGKANDHSKIKLVWGAAEEEVQAAQIGSLGMATKLVKIGRHLTRVRDKRERVRIRRWIFLEWQPPEPLAVENQYVQMPGGGLFKPPSFNDINRLGDWELVYVVGDHSKCDKAVCDSLEFPCHGEYRKPDESDLKKFMRMTGATQDAMIQTDPFSPMSQEIMERLARRTAEVEAKRQQVIEAEEDAYYKDRDVTRKKISFSNSAAN
jgi:hypothetical protein